MIIVMNRKILIPILLSTILLVGCGPSEEQIDQAEERYNAIFLSNFDEEKMLTEGCWSSREFVWTEYIDGEIVISQGYDENKHYSWLYQKTCISDLKTQIDNLSVKDNETILIKERIFNGNAWVDTGKSTYSNDLILFSVENEPAEGHREGAKTSDGCFRFLYIESSVNSSNTASIEINGPNYCTKWIDWGDNDAKFSETKEVGFLEFDKRNYDIDLKRWLDREMLIYHHEVGARYTFEDNVQFTSKDQYRIIDEETMKKLLKDVLIERYEYALSKAEKAKAEELDKKNRKQL